MKTMEDSNYEERVKKRVLILRDLLSEGKIMFNIELKDKVSQSLSKVRYDSNGEPDINTIDAIVRSLALAAEEMNHRTQMMEAISLHAIQEKYFEIIRKSFGEIFNVMIENRITPHIVASRISNNNDQVELLNGQINEFIEGIIEFWESLAEYAYLHLEEDSNSIKAVFGGDLFPAHDENIASKCGIYTDTIVLPCPYIRSQHLFNISSKPERVYYLIKHAMNILKYQDLAIAELDTPIIVILPDKEMLNEFAYDEVKRLRDQDALYHAEKVFERSFDSIEELAEFGEGLNTIDKVLNEVRDRKKVLFDSEFKESLEIQLHNQSHGHSSKLLGTKNPGLIVAMLGVGRMGVCNELLMKSALVGGVPLIDAPTSWEYFKWKIQYDSERANPSVDHSKLHIVKGLNGLSNTKLSWIGKIPAEGLIELRQNGAINEIRSTISKGIYEIIHADAFDFVETSHRVFNNLNSAFNQHQENIKMLSSKKWKVAGKDLGSWLVMGTAEISAACVGKPLFGAAAFFLNQLLDAPKLKDLPKSIEKINDLNLQKDELNKSPLGLMFRYK